MSSPTKLPPPATTVTNSNAQVFALIPARAEDQLNLSSEADKPTKIRARRPSLPATPSEELASLASSPVKEKVTKEIGKRPLARSSSHNSHQLSSHHHSQHQIQPPASPSSIKPLPGSPQKERKNLTTSLPTGSVSISRSHSASLTPAKSLANSDCPLSRSSDQAEPSQSPPLQDVNGKKRADSSNPSEGVHRSREKGSGAVASGRPISSLKLSRSESAPNLFPLAHGTLPVKTGTSPLKTKPPKQNILIAATPSTTAQDASHEQCVQSPAVLGIPSSACASPKLSTSSSPLHLHRKISTAPDTRPAKKANSTAQ